MSVNDNPVSVKDPRFGAFGDFVRDDTAAIQAALDYCFGPVSNPHGTLGVFSNKPLYFPPGHYKISGNGLQVKYLHGGVIFGAGRFVSQIENVTPGGPVFTTNGCGYSVFEKLRLTVASGARCFDLDWDNSPGGAALQGNSFRDIHFDGGNIGIEIGRSGFMGSENLFLNCHFLSCATAGLITSNGNALQQSVVGGNFQNCGTGIFIGNGSVPLISGVGFQLSANQDIYTGSSGGNTMAILGCRSESPTFFNNAAGQAFTVSGCEHRSPSQLGDFVAQAGGTGVIEGCYSAYGDFRPKYWARTVIQGCQFNRDDWLQLDPTHLWWLPNNPIAFSLELENIRFGSTLSVVNKQRLFTPDGQNITTQNYMVQ